MTQITDIGGQDYGDKIKMEGDARDRGMSLGLQPDQGGPPTPTPQRSLPTRQKPKPLNIGRGADFILNGPPKGNNPLAGLGQTAKLLSEDGQAYKDSVSKAKDLMEIVQFH